MNNVGSDDAVSENVLLLCNVKMLKFLKEKF